MLGNSSRLVEELILHPAVGKWSVSWLIMHSGEVRNILYFSWVKLVQQVSPLHIILNANISPKSWYSLLIVTSPSLWCSKIGPSKCKGCIMKWVYMLTNSSGNFGGSWEGERRDPWKGGYQWFRGDLYTDTEWAKSWSLWKLMTKNWDLSLRINRW